MKRVARMSLIFFMLSNGAKTGREILDVLTGISMSNLYTSLRYYELMGYIHKTDSDTRKRKLFSLTSKGKKKLKQIERSIENACYIDFTTVPYIYFDKLIIKNGGEEDIIIQNPELINKQPEVIKEI